MDFAHNSVNIMKGEPSQNKYMYEWENYTELRHMKEMKMTGRT